MFAQFCHVHVVNTCVLIMKEYVATANFMVEKNSLCSISGELEC